MQCLFINYFELYMQCLKVLYGITIFRLMPIFPLLKLTERLGLSTQNDPRKQCFNT